MSAIQTTLPFLRMSSDRACITPDPAPDPWDVFEAQRDVSLTVSDTMMLSPVSRR